MNNDFGLPDMAWIDIEHVVKTTPHVEEALIYGSRAMGTHKDNSDVDIAVKGADVSFEDLLHMHGRLEALNIIYTCDVTHYDTLKNESLKHHIDTHGKAFFRK